MCVCVYNCAKREEKKTIVRCEPFKSLEFSLCFVYHTLYTCITYDRHQVTLKKKECSIHSRYIIPIAYLRLYKHTLRGEDILCTHITDRQQNKEWKGVYVTNTIKYTTFSWHHHSILFFIYLFIKERALPSFSREIELPCFLVFNCVCSAYRTGDIFL